MRFYLLILVIIAGISGCSSVRHYSHGANFSVDPSRVIRVLLQEEPATLQLTIENISDIYDDKLNKIAEVGKGNKLRFTKNGKGLELTINRKVFKGDTFFFKGEEKSYIKGKSYRGVIGVKNSGGRLVVVNYLDLENYLKGVLPGEMPAGKGDEYYQGLKAFAIAARTYAINKIEDNRKRDVDFDLYSDVRDQVYTGANTEKEIFNRVIEETQGELLYYRGERCVVFYHSTCGGVLEDVSNVFPNNNQQYLSGKSDGSQAFCSISPRFVWEEEFTEKEIVAKLLKAGLITNSNYKVKSVQVKSRFESGRANELLITLETNRGVEEVSLYGNNIRYVLRMKGEGLLRSNFIDAAFENNKLKISGRGSGHGVGMCQWGALSMSISAENYRDILAHYFPGTTIMRRND